MCTACSHMMSLCHWTSSASRITRQRIKSCPPDLLDCNVGWRPWRGLAAEKRPLSAGTWLNLDRKGLLWSERREALLIALVALSDGGFEKRGVSLCLEAWGDTPDWSHFEMLLLLAHEKLSGRRNTGGYVTVLSNMAWTEVNSFQCTEGHQTGTGQCLTPAFTRQDFPFLWVPEAPS